MTDQARALLATDALARGLGAGGLHPALRAALKAGLHFPARVVGPQVAWADAAGQGRIVARPLAVGPGCKAWSGGKMGAGA
ncbi:MAG: hypothetical protein A2092_17615 [Rhodobacteraceae bacterium GWE1_64_9]|nr:MAG: hypothetical protein A2092_17615 [Rhodobacteraceae bacterium GWE1_64_9]OHC50653.1 MAG: hypothetical protein A2X69_09065 [Rhodobacteraceae bacterium GWF1_65_7]HBD92197.1 hypothetical protein [Gemmobacter sp.]HBU15066.1 hypothetical protein [Gemmobacter sp.]